MSGKTAKRDEMEKRASGLLDEIEELEARRAGAPPKHPNRKKPVPDDEDDDLPDLAKID